MRAARPPGQCWQIMPVTTETGPLGPTGSSQPSSSARPSAWTCHRSINGSSHSSNPQPSSSMQVAGPVAMPRPLPRPASGSQPSTRRLARSVRRAPQHAPPPAPRAGCESAAHPTPWRHACRRSIPAVPQPRLPRRCAGSRQSPPSLRGTTEAPLPGRVRIRR